MTDTPHPPERRADALDPARAAALHATLARPGPAPAPGDALPPFGHQIYFWDARPPGALGPDGHPAVGTGLIPDLGLAQRMWAGGALEFHAPLRLGQEAVKTSTVERVEEKTGRSGRLGFVTLRHDITQGGTLCLSERQTLVYRDPPTAPTTRPPLAPVDETLAVPVVFDPTLLFRYSALTFNGHRIHYDLDYARDVEGHGGLVVHGPLLAQLLMLMAEAQLGELRRFSFRATAPLYHTQTAELCWRGDGRCWVRADDGRLCMEAEAG